MYDVIIIGKGPAGVTAAVYAARAGYKTLVIGRDGGALAKAENIENYYGFPKPVKGGILQKRGERQAAAAGAELRTCEALSADFAESGILVKTTDGEFAAASLILAVGRKRNAPKLPGAERLTGRGVSFCAACDGFFHRKKDVAVLGGGAYAVSEAEYLKKIAACVTVFTGGIPLAVPEGIGVNTEPLREIKGGGAVEAVLTEAGEYPVSGVFIAEGSAGAFEFAVKLGLSVSGGSIVTDGDLATNIPGIYAAGDCTGGMLQVGKAVRDGAVAAGSAIKFVKQKSS